MRVKSSRATSTAGWLSERHSVSVPTKYAQPNSQRHALASQVVQGFAAIQIAKRKHRRGVTEMERPRDALAIAKFLARNLDEWQHRALTTDRHDILLTVTRQGGKGEVATLLALDGVLNHDNFTVVIVSRTDRQAQRLLRRIKKYYKQLSYVPELVLDSQIRMELVNGSEIIAVPGSEETIRGIEAVDLLIIDEAALVPDQLYFAVQPMTATTNGRTIAMTTARGRRGWFWQEWNGGSDEWHREKITWEQITRFNPDWIARTRRRLGEFMFAQEFGCEFLDDVTQLFATDLVLSAVKQVTRKMLPSLSGGEQ